MAMENMLDSPNDTDANLPDFPVKFFNDTEFSKQILSEKLPKKQQAKKRTEMFR